MQIIIQRESVEYGKTNLISCGQFFKVDDNMDCLELNKMLIEQNYYPPVDGGNEVWVLTTEDYWEVFAYYPKTGKVFCKLDEKELKKISPEGKFIMECYATPARWQEKIFQWFGEKLSVIQRDGWDDEIQYCTDLMKNA